MKIKILLLLLGMQIPLLAQSSISVGTGSSITIGLGSDISAGSRSGSFSGSGTFNGLPLTVPSVVTTKPTNVLTTSATINATINPQQYETTYYFSYGTDPNNLSTNTSTQSAGSGSTDVKVSGNITGLTGNTLYYYKVTATNFNGTSVSDQRILFTDNSISRTNLILWLRADQGITSSSGSVSAWDDLSSSNNGATQGTASYQPSIISSAINSNPAVRFNGSSNYLTLPYSQTIGIKDSSYETFIVARTSSSNIQFLLSSAVIEQYELHLNGTAGVRFIPVTSTYIDEGSAGNYANGNPHVFSSRASSSGGAVRVDGIDGGTTANNILSSSAVNLKLGYRGADASYYFNGDIAEVILYNTNLNSTDRNTVEQYLANRYNITSGALPVELTSFTGSVDDKKVMLSWNTATEVNNYGFNIERRSIAANAASLGNSSSESSWGTIGFIKGNSNSNSPKSYSFVDSNPSSGRVQYRLKQIDFDGRYEYSKVVEVKVAAPIQFALEQNYPNPFNPITTIKYAIPALTPSLSPGERVSDLSGGVRRMETEGQVRVTLIVYDILGREVATLVNEQKESGNYEVQFDGSKLASGTYIYQLRAGDPSVGSGHGFTQTKKLLLMK